MLNLKHLSLGKKVIGFTAILLASMFGISIYSFFKVRNVNQEVSDLTEWIIPLTDSVAIFDSHALEQQVHLQRLLRLYEIKPVDQEKIERELAFFNKRERDIDQKITATNQLIDRAIKNIKVSEDLIIASQIKPLITNLDNQHQRYHNQALKTIEALERGELEKARILEEQLDTEEEQLDTAMIGMLKNLAQFSEKRAQIVKNHEASVFWLATENMAITFIAFALGVLVTAILTQRIVKPVRQIITGADDIAHGNLEVQVNVSSSDEIGMLAQSFNTMAQELKTKERIKATFGQYVDPRVVETLLQQENSGLNNGEKRVMTVFFSDIVGFSKISELLTPLGLVTLVNKYLTLASESIIQNKGVIDKYIGDAVMSFWGAPFTSETEHAKLACLASLQQFEQLEKLNEILPDLLGVRKGLPKLRIRVGLCTGELIVGNIGSNISKSYTVIGDTVNIASRLEGANKQYGTKILISEETYKLVQDDFETREIDNIIVVGKSEPVRIFELLAEKGKIEQPMIELREQFEQGLAAYRNKNWDAAKRCFDTCLNINSSDKPSQVFLDRINILRESFLLEGWNGVWQMTQK